ncbi:MAG: hypothetical protein HZA50_06455 [Planctomycetes bacterium]|nr:hypothetical protein [Planctomycetota bacterium]
MEKTLYAKLADIHANADSKAFILADAKDADMAFGIAAPGRSPEHVDGGFRSLQEYREIISQNVAQELLDIMLMSVSTNEVLTIRRRIFDSSPVTPAIRANDTTDIHVARGSSYPKAPARPFRTALLDHAQCGSLCDDDSRRHLGANLGLFSMTFNNDPQLDLAMLEAYKAFRVEAELKDFQHFLEIFPPNAPANPIAPDKLGGFLNDMIVRALAGVAQAARPLFLKMAYTGPKAMEELVHYDRHLVPGVLGGSAGTTYDAFKLLAEAKKYGARAALFGRKINNAEHQLTFIQFLRWIADGAIAPEEAVRAYHGALQGMGIKSARPLEDDLRQTDQSLSYGGAGTTISIPSQPTRTAFARPETAANPPAQKTANPPSAAAKPAGDYPRKADGNPDFARMTQEQILTYHRDRLGIM